MLVAVCMDVRTGMESIKDLVSLEFLLHKWKWVVAWQPNEHSQIYGEHLIRHTLLFCNVHALTVEVDNPNALYIPKQLIMRMPN